MTADQSPKKERRVGSKRLLLEYFSRHLVEVLTAAELQRAAGGASEWGRRLRELRDEEGYDIKSHKDDLTLKPGQYRLDSLTRRDVTRRAIDNRLRAKVMAEAAGICQWCGAVAGKPHPEHPERVTTLQASHIIDKVKGGADSLNNLIALCSFCNEGASIDLQEPPRAIQLLSQIRRAPKDVQREVFERLRAILGEG